MSFQKPAADHWNKVHIAAFCAAFAMVAGPTLAPGYTVVRDWLFPKENIVATHKDPLILKTLDATRD